MTALARPAKPRIAAVAPPRPVTAAADRLASRIFVHLGLIGCIVLQRFCFYVGGSPIYFCLPIFLALVVWMLAADRAALRPLSVGWYALFASAGLISTLVAIDAPDQRITDLSVASLYLLLVLYAGLTVRPRPPFDGSRTWDIFLFYVRLCAVLGIAQYLLQFVGIRLFSFMALVPSLRPLLAEPLFNSTPYVAYGSSIIRSNGFFLVEPSTFSQLLMLGVLVEFFLKRSWHWLPLYGVAYIFTYAGTGLLALALACGLYLLTLPRDAGRVLTFAVVAAVLGAVGLIAFPGQLEALTGRASELNYSGSSGYARYVTQFDMIGAVWGETRTLFGFGPGALERASFYVPGGGNPSLKLFIEYGVIGLAAFWAFFATALWRRDAGIVVCFALVNFQLGGGNLLFPPFVVLVALLCIWSRPPSYEHAVQGTA